jgi:hypothetical protein
MAAPIIKGVGDSVDSLSALVDQAANAGVRRMMWDKYNPKHLAGNRLRTALTSQGIELQAHSTLETSDSRSILLDKCRRKGIELVDAF